MDVDTVFKVILIVEFSLFSIIRILYHVLARRAGYRTIVYESKRYSAWLALLICYEVVTLFVFIFWPQAFGWAAISMSAWLRWVGATLGALALCLFIWVRQNLGKNFSARLAIKEPQVLVTNGPYKRVRHPMYTAFYMLHIAVFFLTGNWFIGVTWLAGLCIIVALRVRKEEAIMVWKFGEQYRSYMKRTGRFLPLVKTDVFSSKE